MKKVLKKVLTGVTALALVAGSVMGFNATQSIKADTVSGSWAFAQGGVYANAQETEWGNVGYINSVSMNGGEVIDGWLRGDGSSNQTQTATSSSNGFTIDIENTGWDCMWKDVTGYSANRINPWSIQAINKYAAQAGHDYTITFKARASKKKFAYFALGSNIEGTGPTGEDLIYDGNGNPAQQVLALGVADQSFTFKFTNWVSASEISATLMLGAFDAQEDFAGNDISSIVTEVENNWNGQVIISDFTISDNGVNPDYKPDPTVPVYTTVAPTQAPKTSSQTVTPDTPVVKTLGKVAGLKVKNTKKKTVKVSFKKVANAKKYQIKVGNKNFTSTKTTKTIKNKVVKKGKKITVKVRATAAGYTAGAWATKKIKIKK